MVKALLKLYLLLFVCCVSFVVNAQVVDVDLTTFTNTPVSHTFLSRNTVAVSLPATFGEVTVEETNTPFQYKFTYVPDLDFEGNDESRILYFPMELPNTFALMRFNIEVVPVDLEVNHDVASTLAGTSVTIPVLDNDFSTTGVLSLVTAPAVNGGTAEVVGDEIIFTPDASFQGLTDFNYVVCATSDGYEYCKTGTVSVNVLSNIGVASADTTRAFVKRNASAEHGAMLLAPSNYTLSSSPQNGTIENINGVLRYYPDENHIGVEYLTFSNGNNEMVFRVETLEFEFNFFSVDDEVVTLPNESTTLNVVQNDLYGAFTGCISFNPPQYGTLIPGGTTGEVTYVPPVGWTGVDRFTYTSFPPGCASGTGETSTVTVVISDFSPASTFFSLTTGTNISLPLTYQTPEQNISWTVVTPPTLGELVNSDVDGNLIYVPDADVVGVDFLTVSFCLQDDSGDCSLVQNVDVEINVVATDAAAANCGGDGSDDCVWPGDTNNDGIVNISDLLPIGYYMGSAGTPRTSTAPESWAPQFSEDWLKVDNGVNRKHVDANGDQFVTSQDTQIVRSNLGMVNRIYPFELPVADFDFILDGDIFAEPGDIIELDVFLGSSYIGVEDLVGFIFPFVYDPNFFDPSSVYLDFDDGSWFSYDSPTLGMGINDTIAGSYQFGLTRTSGVPASGHGRIASLYIGVEDLVGFRPTQNDDEPHVTPVIIGGDAGEAMNNTGNRSAVRVRPFELNIVHRPQEVEPIDGNIDAYLEDKLLTFPNPTSDKLTVHLNGRREFTDMTILDMTGRIVESYNGSATNHRVIDLSDYKNGIYTLQVTTKEGVVTRKIQVFH